MTLSIQELILVIVREDQKIFSSKSHGKVSHVDMVD